MCIRDRDNFCFKYFSEKFRTSEINPRNRKISVSMRNTQKSENVRELQIPVTGVIFELRRCFIYHFEGNCKRNSFGLKYFS